MSAALARPRLWFEVGRAGFRQHSTYRAATVAGLFTNIVFAALRIAVMLAVIDATASKSIAGYDRDASVTYIWLGQGLIAVIAIWNWNDIAIRIPTGEIATDLLRPADFQMWWLARDLGRAWWQLLTRGVPPVLIGALTTGLLAPDPTRAVFLPLSLALAVAISFALRFIANLAVFWTHDWRGVAIAFNILITLFSGFEFPLEFFPGWAERLLRALPWYGAVQAPLDTYLGRGNLSYSLLAQLLWFVALLAAGRAVMRRATQRVTVQGG